MFHTLPTTWQAVLGSKLADLPLLIGLEQTKFSWAKAVECYAEVPDAYRPGLDRLLPSRDALSYAVLTPTFEGFITRYMNYARDSVPAGETVVAHVWQPEIRSQVLALLGEGPFRTVAPAHLIILTRQELIIIRDEDTGVFGGDRMPELPDVTPDNTRPGAGPVTERPLFPDGYGVPETEEGLLPWSHARERLERARVYWIATVAPTGRPHITPVWGVWIDDTLYFDGSPEARRVKNMATNPRVVVHLDSGGEGKDVLIVHGEAREVPNPDHALTTRVAADYTAKYAADNYAPKPDQWDNGGLYAMRPRMALAWTKFFEDATRWRFEARRS